MKLLSKLFGRFFKKKADRQSSPVSNASANEEKHPGMVRTCLHLPYSITHPSDIMEGLGIAVVNDTKTYIVYNLSEVSLLDMSTLDGNFIGSFYALKRNGTYYGNIVGHREIIACETDAFRFKETDLLKIPFAQQEQVLHALLCRYQKNKGSIRPLLWGRFNNGILQETLYMFPKNASMHEALDYCQKEVNKS